MSECVYTRGGKGEGGGERERLTKQLSGKHV